MRRPYSSQWILVVGFLAIGLLNLAINPFAVQGTRASVDCNEADKPTDCQCGDPICSGGGWVCPTQ